MTPLRGIADVLNAQSMMSSAHKAGVHSGFKTEHKAAPKEDLTSFTRRRILASKGSWDGDPLEGPS